jgi:putative phosphoesterase
MIRGREDRVKKSLIGVISDTHGLLRPEALKALRKSDLIIHAGDIGKPEVIEALKSMAPVVAIRGNNDKGRWARRFPETAVVKIGKIRLYVIHDLKELEIDPATAGFRAVISGHSHRPSVVKRCGVLFLNPGSAGPRRFTLPVALARLRVRGESVTCRIVELRA